jgi:hypothetical protein
MAMLNLIVDNRIFRTNMGLKEIKKLADALNESGKQELLFFLQSRMNPLSSPIRAIDEIQEQKHKAGLVCPHCDSLSVRAFLCNEKCFLFLSKLKGYNNIH